MTVARAVRGIGRRRPAHAVILLYHRVAEPQADPFRLAVSPKRFEQQLELLHSRHRVIALDALPAELDDPPRAEPTIVVTFDDGYADNLERAAPIADALEIPITVFVAVGPVVAGTPFWWDELTELVCVRPVEEQTIAVRVGNRQRGFRVSSERERLRACIDLHGLLRRLPESARRRVLDELAAASSTGREAADGRPLAVDELRRLDRLPGVTIGSHTVSHPALTSLATSDREAEIAGSKATLEELLGHGVDLFSYPYGRGSDLDAETVRVTAAAGYRAACTTVQAGVSDRSRPHALPRLTVLDWTPAELARALAELRLER